MEYIKSKTYENIINAYKGELAGEVLYRLLSKKFSEMGKKEIESTLLQLSFEERGHVNVLKKYIEYNTENFSLSDEEIQKLNLLIENPVEALKNFSLGEKKVGEEMYPYFSKIAKEEGYSEISKVFDELAKVELKHEKLLNKKIEELIS